VALKHRELIYFVQGGDKEPPPAFVGRGDILSRIERDALRVWRGTGASIHGAPGVTNIIHGAPGAGKSSILHILESRSLKAANMEVPRVLRISSEMLGESVPRVLTALREVGRMERREWVERGRGFMGRAARRVDSVTVGGTGIGLSENELDGLLALKEVLPPSRWARPVIVAVDEAQNLPPDRNSAPGLFLQGIHNGGTGLPLALVLAGLGDTPDRAVQLGLTRGRTDHAVGRLGTGDMAGAMRGFCRRFGVDPAGHGTRLDALAEPTEGWPRHLHFALQALGRAVLAADGDLGRVGWDPVGREAAESRVRYYEDQRSPAMVTSEDLVARVMRAVPGADADTPGARGKDILRTIMESVRDEPGWELPKGMDRDAFFTHLVHQGALQRRAGGLYHCPIPSFRRHLVRAGGLDPDGGAVS